MLFTFLLVVHAIIAAGLVTVILMQRSEGGGLGMGGSPSGLMSARGAADFLTRMTSILATLFVAMSILLAVLAATGKRITVDTTQAPTTAPAGQGFGLGGQQQTPDDGTAFGAGAANAIAPADNAAAAPDNGAVPIQR